MFVPTFLFIWTACLLMFEPVSCPEDSQEVTAKPGDDVTLQCRGPRDASITVLKWSRTDQKPDDGYVFFFRDDDSSYEHYQHPSFRGRVQLRDPEMKDGDVSVVLKNVTINDTGTYECQISAASRRRRRNAPELISIIKLTVTDSGLTAGNTEDGGTKDGGTKDGGTKDGNVGLKVGLPVGVLLLLVGGVVGFMIFRNHRRRTENNSYQPPAGEETDQQQKIPMDSLDRQQL